MVYVQHKSHHWNRGLWSLATFGKHQTVQTNLQVPFNVGIGYVLFDSQLQGDISSDEGVPGQFNCCEAPLPQVHLLQPIIANGNEPFERKRALLLRHFVLYFFF